MATYKDAGVDLQVYQQAMARLPQWMRRTDSPRVVSWPGGFAGLFRLDFASSIFRRGYREPVLVAGTDGVGTKIEVARLAGRHRTIGIDLVAMCVNDVLCCGAEPLFFLDYVAMPRDNPPLLEQIVAGISDGCLQAECALLGGETAIHPPMTPLDSYDLAGFCVGVVEEADILRGQAIEAGDRLVGVASSGLHSNGYSLVRRVAFELNRLSLDQYIESIGATVQDGLLQPTRIYAATVRKLLSEFPRHEAVRGLAHITGGGLAENIERIVPPGLRASIDWGSWPIPPIFHWLQQLGDIPDDELRHVFNMGIGMVFVVSAAQADHVCQWLRETGESCWTIGQITFAR